MSTAPDVDTELGIEELRARFLEHTRAAFALLDRAGPLRILDVGCGSGLQTVELARISDSTILGVDPDGAALEICRQRIAAAGMQERVAILRGSILDAALEAEGFDLLWEEGVLHLLDPAQALGACHRLLRPRGHLVMHETLRWFDTIRPRLAHVGFALTHTRPLPPRIWWTAYGAPLEARIQTLKAAHPEAADDPALARHERDVAWIKSDPDRTDCAFYVLEKQPYKSQGN